MPALRATARGEIPLASQAVLNWSICACDSGVRVLGLDCLGACSGALAGAEERGRRAGERFEEALRERDPETARIFGEIAEEEVAHIQLAWKYFPAREETQALA